MIIIKIRPKRYSRAALQQEFRLFSDNEDDFNEWLTAMQITGQLEERQGFFIPTRPPEVDEKPVAIYRDFETILYRGKKTAEKPELGIHEKWDENKKYYPTEMRILKFKDAKGKWVDIKEKPIFTYSKAREQYKNGKLIKKGEKWRAGLPAITKIYGSKGLKIGTTVHVKIMTTSKEYYQTLKLWGYAVEAMVSFGETSARVNPRDLELHGWQFPFETKGPILAELKKIGTAAIEVMSSWLATFDLEYSLLLKNSRNAGTSTEVSPPLKIAGASLYKPFKNAQKGQAKVQLYDHDAKTVKPERATVYGKIPTNWHELDPDNVAMLFSFSSPRDDKIGNAKGYHGRKKDYGKLRTKKTTLDQLKSGKEGEGFA